MICASHESILTAYENGGGTITINSGRATDGFKAGPAVDVEIEDIDGLCDLLQQLKADLEGRNVK